MEIILLHREREKAFTAAALQALDHFIWAQHQLMAVSLSVLD